MIVFRAPSANFSVNCAAFPQKNLQAMFRRWPASNSKKKNNKKTSRMNVFLANRKKYTQSGTFITAIYEFRYCNYYHTIKYQIYMSFLLFYNNEFCTLCIPLVSVITKFVVPLVLLNKQ